MGNALAILLGEVCEILDSRRKPITKKHRVPGPYPYYGASGIVDYVEDYLFDEDLLLVSEDGANLLARTYPIAFSISGKTWVNNHAHVLRFPNMTYQRFAEYYLNSISLKPYVSGMAQPKLNQGKLREIPVPMPLLPEQERIVAILDEAFAAIATATANAEKNLANARELFESELNRVFSQEGDVWVGFELQELTTKIGSGATPKGGAKSYKQQGISLIRSLNVHDRRFKYQELALIDNDQANLLSNVAVESGDVLFNITGASIARCCVVPKEVLPARVNQHVSIVRPKSDRLSSKFLCYLMTSRPYKNTLVSIGEGGATRQAITKKQLQALPVKIPDLRDEQERIVARLDKHSAKKQSFVRLFEQKATLLTELKRSLLHNAFTGELTADPNTVDHELTKAGV